MKCNSKKRGGFTLIEIIISMAVITIISVSVYSGFKIMIKGTKQGEVKQISTLIGNQISEQIKAASVTDLTTKINLTKVTGDKYTNTTSPLYFKEDGNMVNVADNYRYRVNVELDPKKPIGSDIPVSIKEVLNDNDNTNIENRNICIVKEKDESAEIANKNDVVNINSENVDGDKTVKIEMIDTADKIKVSSDGLVCDMEPYSVNNQKQQQITLDLNYCTGKIIVEVTNPTKIPLNLFILNGINAEISNKKGILHEYRRSEVGSKMGTLYDVKVKIFDDKSVDGFDIKPIFETSFVQNINIK